MAVRRTEERHAGHAKWVKCVKLGKSARVTEIKQEAATGKGHISVIDCETLYLAGLGLVPYSFFSLLLRLNNVIH